MTARVGLGAILAAAILLFFKSVITFWIAFVLALSGIGLLILSLIDSIRSRRASDSISLFQDGLERLTPTRRRISPFAWPAFLSKISLLYAQILLLLVIPGVLMFHFAWGHGRPLYGLYVATDLSPIVKRASCGASWFVRIDEREHWYLNSTKTNEEELSKLLRQQLGESTNCAVYLDVDGSLPYFVAVHAIDAIQTTQAKVVVLVTPQMKIR